MVATYVAGSITFAVCGVLMFLLFRSLYRLGPAGVMKRLPTAGSEYSIRLNRITSINGAWNPSKPLAIANLLCTLGHGTYRRTDDDHVELTWIADTGSTHTYRGTIPDALRPASPQRRRTRHVLHAIAAVYAAVAIVGFGLGFFLSTGTTAARLGFGLLGVFIDWVAVWLVILVLNVAHGTKGALRGRGRSAIDPPAP